MLDAAAAAGIPAGGGARGPEHWIKYAFGEEVIALHCGYGAGALARSQFILLVWQYSCDGMMAIFKRVKTHLCSLQVGDSFAWIKFGYLFAFFWAAWIVLCLVGGLVFS